MNDVQHRAGARAAKQAQPDQPDAEARAGTVAEGIDARSVLWRKRALLQEFGGGRCADRVAARQPEDDCGSSRGRQAVQPGERPRGKTAERVRKAGAHEQRACHEKREQRGQRLARGERQAVAHPVRAGGRAKQERRKQRER